LVPRFSENESKIFIEMIKRELPVAMLVFRKFD